MSETVFIEALEVDAVVGVYDWEQQTHQRLQIDVAMSQDFTLAAASDAIADALDYAEVSAWVRAHVASRSWQLIETIAVVLAERLVAHFGIRGVRLVVRKPGAVLGTASVGVVVERGETSHLLLPTGLRWIK